VRDLDVFFEYLADYALEAPAEHRGALRAVADSRRRQRQALRREAEVALAGEAYQAVESALRRVAHSRSAIARRRARPAWREARRALREHLQRLLEHGRKLKALSPLQQHQVRIDCKRFRYLAEFFQDFYGQDLRDAIKAAVRLQDLLGQVHDSFVYADWLCEELRRLGPPGERAIDTLLDHLGRQRRESLRQAGRIWKSFTSKRLSKRLDKILKSPRRV
jgi:CHAD domain-containing protein